MDLAGPAFARELRRGKPAFARELRRGKPAFARELRRGKLGLTARFFAGRKKNYSDLLGYGRICSNAWRDFYL